MSPQVVYLYLYSTRASNEDLQRFQITEKAPKKRRPLLWFKTLLRHYDKQLPKHVDIILGHRHKDYKGCALSMTVKSSRAFVWSSIPTYIFLVSAEADTWYGWWQPGLGAGQRRRGRGGGDRGLGLMRLRPAVIITAKLSQAPLLETNTQITSLILACAAMCCLHDRKTYPV